MAEVTIQDALEYCLANPDGLGVEELLSKFPEYREELRPLLALSRQVGEVAPPTVPAERRAAMKVRLMEAAAAQRQDAPVEAGRAEERVVVQERKPGWLWAILRRPLLAGAAGAVALVALVWWGAAAALPNSPFYSIKIASENVLLNFAGGAADKAKAHLGLASSRLDDIEAMNRQNLLADAIGAVSNYQEHLDSCATLWKETTGDVREAIKANISASVTRCELAFNGFGANVAGLPESARASIGQMYNSLSVIRGDIGESTFIDAPEGITVTIAPQPTPAATAARTPVVGTPGVSGSPTGVALPSVSPVDGTSVVGTPTIRIVGTETPLVSGTGTQTIGVKVATETVVGQTQTPVTRASETVAPTIETTAILPTGTPTIGATALPTSVTQPTRTLFPPSIVTPGITPTATNSPTSTATPSSTPSPVIKSPASPTIVDPQPVLPIVTPQVTIKVPLAETVVPAEVTPPISLPVLK